MNIQQKEQFYGEIIEALKEELNCLKLRIKRARENNDFGNYKNMIVAFKEVLGIYKGLVDDGENVIPITYNIHVETVKADDGMAFIEKLKKASRERGVGI